jgi:hypothetical protein
MQGMLDNLSQPVAFATVPLNAPEDIPPAESSNSKTESRRRDEVLSSDTDADEPIFSKFTRKIGMSREGSRPGQSSSNRNHNAPSSSQQASYNKDDDSDFEDFLEDGMDVSF